MRKVPEIERFWEKVDKTEESDCWTWKNALDRDGYGYLRRYRGPMVGAHVFSYEIENGPVPEGKEIDHACRNRSCVNPLHLRAVTHKQNMENRGLQCNNTSGAAGVTWNKRSRKWLVYVSHEGKKVYGGGFLDVDQAIARSIELRSQLYTNYKGLK